MPIYCYECETHGRFEISCRLADWDDHKKCPQEGCDALCEQVLTPSRGTGTIPTIIVHVSADGSYRFPGSPTARVPQGFQKKELRTIREVEQLERDVNRTLHSEARQHQENEERHFAAIKEKLRSDLRQAMQSMSPQGRDFARFAMERNNQRSRKKTEVGFHVEILHLDRSNREPYCDAPTGWKRKYL